MAGRGQIWRIQFLRLRASGPPIVEAATRFHCTWVSDRPFKKAFNAIVRPAHALASSRAELLSLVWLRVAGLGLVGHRLCCKMLPRRWEGCKELRRGPLDMARSLVL